MHLLPGPIRSFLQRHPRVRRADPPPVRRRHARDAAAGRDRLRDPLSAGTAGGDGYFAPFRTADRLVIAPRHHPIHRIKTLTAQALSRYPFILPWPGSATRKVIEGLFAERGLPLRISLEAGGWETIKRYAGLGLGIGVVPDFCLEQTDRRIAVRSARHLFGAGHLRHRDETRPGTLAAARALVAEIAPRSGV